MVRSTRPSYSVLNLERYALGGQSEPCAFLRAMQAKHNALVVPHDRVGGAGNDGNACLSRKVGTTEIGNIFQVEDFARSRNVGNAEVSDAETIDRKRVRLAAKGQRAV